MHDENTHPDETAKNLSDLLKRISDEPAKIPRGWFR